MNEKKPEDVMRALECHIKRRCWDCPIGKEDIQQLSKPCSQLIAELALALLREKDAEIERLNVELQAMRCAANSYKMHYESARAEVITVFADLAIKRICEKVVAPTPSESYIVEKCNQIIYETEKEMRGKTDGKTDL